MANLMPVRGLHAADARRKRLRCDWGLAAAFLCVAAAGTMYSAPAVADDVDISILEPFTGKQREALITSIGLAPNGDGGGQPAPQTEGQPKPGSLRIYIKEGAQYTIAAPGYPFAAKVFSGSESIGDTDSAQCAVRWMKADKKTEVARDANAKPQGVRTSASKWTPVDGTAEGKGIVYWDTPIPDGAEFVEAVLVFTDVIDHTNAARFGNSNVDPDKSIDDNGDMPAVIGSWDGSLNGRTWTFKKLDGDIFPRPTNWPKFAEVTRLTDAAKGIVSDRTGYKLQERPPSLLGLKTKREIINAIRAAADANQINNTTDTGFDIVP